MQSNRAEVRGGEEDDRSPPIQLFEATRSSSQLDTSLSEVSLGFEESLGSFPAYAAGRPYEPYRPSAERVAECVSENRTLENSTHIRVSLQPGSSMEDESDRQASVTNQIANVLEEASNHHRTSGASFVNAVQDEGMTEIDLNEDEKPRKKAKKAAMDASGGDQDDDEEQSNASDSYVDDEPSTIDMAEENEKKVRLSLFYAFLTACGIIFLGKLIGKWLRRCSNNSDGADGSGQGITNVVGGGETTVVKGAAEGGSAAFSAQAPTNMAMAQSLTQHMALSASQVVSTSAAAATTAASGGVVSTTATSVLLSNMLSSVASASLPTQLAVAVGATAVVTTGAVSGGLALLATLEGTFPSSNSTNVTVATSMLNLTGDVPNVTSTLPNMTLVEDSHFNMNDTANESITPALFDNAVFDALRTTDSVPILGEETGPTRDTSSSFGSCAGYEGVTEIKEGVINLVLTGVPQGFVERQAGELEDLFVLSYNGLSGMCGGDFQRIVQSATLADVNTVLAGPMTYCILLSFRSLFFLLSF